MAVRIMDETMTQDAYREESAMSENAITRRSFLAGSAGVAAVAAGAGFLLAIGLFATIRERLEFAEYPKCFEGFPIALVTAALLSLAFMGFQGMKIF